MTHDPLHGRRGLRRAVRRLSLLERRVLELSAADGLDNRAIAEKLALSLEHVERMLARAIIKLDRALDPDPPWWQFW